MRRAERLNESPGHMKEEGFTLRDAGLTVAEAVGAVGITAALVDRVGPAGLLAFPPLLLLFWRKLRQPPEPAEKRPWLNAEPNGQWLEEAYASWRRGTHISTLAVRYDVDPEWMESELAEMKAAHAP